MEKVKICEETCKGCALCVTACPKKIVELDKTRITPKGFHPARVTDMDKCTSCAMCAVMCPDVAIVVEK